jgi:photosystem II stability/assembly factor-like uncharacterized protein
MHKLKILFAIILFCANSIYPQQYGWQVVYKPANGRFVAIDFVDSLYGWVYNIGEGLLRTTDGGFSWINSNTGVFSAIMHDINFIDYAKGWAIGDNNSNNAIYKTIDSGKTWQEVYYANEQSMPSGQGVSINKVIAVGSERNQQYPDTAMIVKTIDGGENFSIEYYIEELAFQKKITFKKILFTEAHHGWIYGEYSDSLGYPHAAFLKTNDGGENWTRFYISRSVNNCDCLIFQTLTFIDSLRGWAWNNYGPPSFYKTTDGGITWDSLFSFDRNPPRFMDIYFIDSLNGWSFGYQVYQGQIKEVIYKTTNGGYDWELESIALSDYAYDGKMLSTFLGYAAADDAILKYSLITNVEKLSEIPMKFFLRNNYPNPFNPTTTIEYEIPERSNVELKVFDVLGREIQTLVNEEQEAGVYRVKFNGNNLPSGIYLYSLITKKYKETKQMILLK